MATTNDTKSTNDLERIELRFKDLLDVGSAVDKERAAMAFPVSSHFRAFRVFRGSFWDV